VKILFITLYDFRSIEDEGIYSDLMRKFRDEGHDLFIVSPYERKYAKKTELISHSGTNLLKVRTLNIQKTNFIEKFLGIFFIEFQYKRAIKKYFSDVSFGLIIYSTPPITLTRLIRSLKKSNGVKSYLLLKDIFPQNAVDLNLISTSSILYKYFKKIEKDLYDISDYIGCMSPANIKYLIKENPGIDINKIELCPNSIEIREKIITSDEIDNILKKYNIPENKTKFIYGGNLGKPQGLDFLLDIIKSNSCKTAFFIIVGSGTEYNKIRKWFNTNNPKNAVLINSLGIDEYEILASGCDVGLIFLDPRFTVPNFPSRLLSYLKFKLPIIAATDESTDVGTIAVENNFGYWVKNGDLEEFNNYLQILSNNSEFRKIMGENGYHFLTDNYSVENSYSTIIKHFDNV